MPTIDVPLKRFSVVSTRPFDEVVARLTATIGKVDDLAAFRAALRAAKTEAEVEAQACRTDAHHPINQTIRALNAFSNGLVVQI